MENFLRLEFIAPVAHLLRMLFLWSGYAILVGLFVGLAARSSRCASPFVIFGLGMVGVTVGACVGRTIFQIDNFDPISPAGITFSIISAFLALIAFYVFTFFVSTNEDPQEYEEYDARISRTLASMERRELEDTILDMLHEYPESYEYFDRYFRNR